VLHPTTIELASWVDALSLFRELGEGWVFRGQRDANWELVTNLQRPGLRLLPEQAEREFHREFTHGAHNYLSANEMPQTMLEWLALMQHHGTPTRLLDWTESPFVACYFALEEAVDCRGSCAVWAVDLPWVAARAGAAIQRVGDGEFAQFKLKKLWQSEEFKRLVLDGRLTMVVPALPRRRNRRLVAQQGLFLVPANLGVSFLENLGDGTPDIEGRVVKIVLRNSMREEALDELALMNINRATLFPGLDGFAQSLKYGRYAHRDERTIQREAERALASRHKFIRDRAQDETKAT